MDAQSESSQLIQQAAVDTDAELADVPALVEQLMVLIGKRDDLKGSVKKQIVLLALREVAPKAAAEILSPMIDLFYSLSKSNFKFKNVPWCACLRKKIKRL